MDIDIGRHNAQPWHPHSPPDASDIVVQVTDILYEYLPPHSGIRPEEAVERIQDVLHSDVGLMAYVKAALHANDASAEDVVVQLADALELPSPAAPELMGRLLEVVDSPLALEVYDNEMKRRQPRDVDSWQ